MTPIRAISVIVPMRDEAEHVDDLVSDIAAQDFDGDVELLVADGGSRDGSPQLVMDAAARSGVDATIVDNPRQTVAPGLNACIALATGDLVVRLDAHSRYPRDYLRRCAEASEETGAENVGGAFEAEGRTPFERSVACALDSPFGGVNWSRDVGSRHRVEADTVYCGAFRPEAFELAGTFDENLVRNQDDEFNLRLRLAGGRVVFDPAIRARYRPRASLARVFRQYHEYGFWKVAVMAKHRRPPTTRALVPPLFVLSVCTLGLAGVRSRPARRLLGAELALYGAASLAFAGAAARSRDEPLALVPAAAASFAAFHLGYGSGVWRGAARLLRAQRRT